MNTLVRTTLALVCFAGFGMVGAGQVAAQDTAAQDTGAQDTGAQVAAQEDSAQDADALARRVAETTGDPSKLDELTFSFVVERDGQEVARRRHVWRPKQGALTVSSGDDSYELRNLHDHDLSKLAKDPEQHADTWGEVAPDAEPEQAAKAWSWFINDSYWLLVPAKLFDPGVNRSLDEQGRLVLTFGEVGLTPGDRYMLTVDGHTHRVTRWDFELEGGRTGGFRWTGYEQVGPLLLSTERVSDDGGLTIRFEDLEAE